MSSGSPDVISSAANSGVLTSTGQKPSSRNVGYWGDIRPSVQSMWEEVQGRTTLFLGSALSSFKPTCLPAWDKFVELLCTSILDQATTDVSSHDVSVLREIILRPLNVANYHITELIARRLGDEYIGVLKAFTARRESCSFCHCNVNRAHLWAAERLQKGEVSVIVTTDFDNCLEKALEVLEASQYEFTGREHHSTLVIVVNGRGPSRFAVSLMAQMNRRKVTFLFKIHGSQYRPETRIDTRLQREQSLPSHTVRIMETLLRHTVMFVACYSWSDMEENLDYLCMDRNRDNSRIIWLQRDSANITSAVRKLFARFNDNTSSSGGRFCLMEGSICLDIPRDGFGQFEQAIRQWANGIGPSCGIRSVEEKALSVVADNTDARQDWNAIMCSTNLDRYTDQATKAKLRLPSQEVNGLPPGAIPASVRGSVKEQSPGNVFESATHSGLGYRCSLWRCIIVGNEKVASLEALRHAFNIAWLVGDRGAQDALGNIIRFIEKQSLDTVQAGDTNVNDQSPLDLPAENVAFIDLDNVSMEINKYDVPPEKFIRALLHRAILFTDAIALTPNVLTNSRVFIHEVLFHGGSNKPDKFYLQFLRPLLPRVYEGKPRALTAFRNDCLHKPEYVKENVAWEKISVLEDYFEKENKYEYYDGNQIGTRYGSYIEREVSNDFKQQTKKHLMEHFDSSLLETSDHSAYRDNAEEIADKLLNTLPTYLEHVQPVTRSKLYRFGDLSEQASDEDIRNLMKPGESGNIQPLPTADEEAFLRNRHDIISKPWLSARFCHEMFHPPYNANIPFEKVIESNESTSVFFVPNELGSWMFAATVSSRRLTKIIQNDALL
ncbi:hypothetical protein BDV27DRAFT_158419 [Aspergillus caelatus]|uniref:Uncharacterized protein n=1 Tax=Aspergillus caelatus TaxID=61420 RepID=A0A5N7A2N3_9EURO|nr:uncharacterized protein BDV27DRAFT_158419 [Aspergillus caelatus]KAE8363803.1 hypothetical protein BDV27DRAFT_158419 [Aspergillus caelatus]